MFLHHFTAERYGEAERMKYETVPDLIIEEFSALNRVRESFQGMHIDTQTLNQVTAMVHMLFDGWFNYGFITEKI